jgi:hypothetical protein
MLVARSNENKQERWMELTQPVMIHNFIDEFDLPEDTPLLLARPGEVPTAADGIPLAKHEATIYRKGAGKLLDMMKCSRHDDLNRCREISRFMSVPTTIHLNRMYRIICHILPSAVNILNLMQSGMELTKLFSYK